MTTVTFDPFEVIRNSFADLGCIAFSEMLCNPFKWVVVALTKIARLASWNNIITSVSAAFINGNIMILMQYTRIVPQLRRVSAIRARSVKIFNRINPIRFYESCRKGQFSASSALIPCSYFVWVAFTPISIRSLEFILMQRSVLSNCIFCFLWVISVTLFSLSFNFILMSQAPLSIVLSILLHVRFFILSRLSIAHIAIVVIPLLTISIYAISALNFKAIWVFRASLIRTEKFCGAWISGFTNRALFKGEGLIDHRNLLSSLLGIRGGPAPRIAVVKRFITPLQARLQYITDRSVR